MNVKGNERKTGKEKESKMSYFTLALTQRPFMKSFIENVPKIGTI